jgi:addiction module HigA family antidote
VAHEQEREKRNRRAASRAGADASRCHPARGLLPVIGEAVAGAAKKLGVTRQHLHRILAETAPVRAEMAIRLGKFCGNGPELWLRLQQTGMPSGRSRRRSRRSRRRSRGRREGSAFLQVARNRLINCTPWSRRTCRT